MLTTIASAGLEDPRVLHRLVVPFRDARFDQPEALPQVKLGGADQVANILNEKLSPAL